MAITRDNRITNKLVKQGKLPKAQMEIYPQKKPIVRSWNLVKPSFGAYAAWGIQKTIWWPKAAIWLTWPTTFWRQSWFKPAVVTYKKKK